MRTLNDIVPPSKRKDQDPINVINQQGRDTLNLTVPPSRFPRNTIIVSAIVALGAIGALFYFTNASVRVIPNSITTPVKSSLTADNASNTLSYKIISAQKIASQSVKGSGAKAVTSSASGIITIYNTQASSQKLITNTRFATPEGLIFRIRSSATIPGGSTAKPGSLSIKVYADKPGSTYNVGPSTFSIPGFAGTSQEGKVYAKSSSAMTGGASGDVPVVDSALEESTRAALKTALQGDLVSNLKAQVPEGYTLLDGSYVATYQPAESASTETTGMVEIREQGTISGVVFPSGDLAKAIASSITDLAYNGEPIMLGQDSKLDITIEGGVPTDDKSSLTFAVDGNASLIYVVDPTRIGVAVSGKSRSEALTALKSYPEVKTAYITLRPFWRQTMPKDPTSIKVSVDRP